MPESVAIVRKELVMAMLDRQEMLARVRQKRQERDRNKRDPDEWRCPKADKNDKFEFYFIVLWYRWGCIG
jgi:ribosomal protein L32E